MKRLRVTVCRGPECGIFSAAIVEALRLRIAELGLGSWVSVDHQSCFGRCRSGPNLVIAEVDDAGSPAAGRLGLATLPDRGQATMYNGMTPETAVRALESHALRLLG